MPKPEPCPTGTAVNQTQAYPCGDGGVCNRTCQVDMTLTECVCGSGGGEAGTGTAGTSAAGTSGSGTSGTGADDDDGGTTTVPETDGGMSTVDSGGNNPNTPPRAADDGSQLAACTSDIDCEGGRVCYLGSASVGYCSEPCSNTSDCAGIAGATYTCSVSAGACRIECQNADDDSCPELMTCQAATLGGVYRCAYDEKYVGSADVALFGACQTDGDCKDDLVCYTGLITAGLGGMYQGYCAQVCSGDIDCTEDPTTGNVAATCGSGVGADVRECRLDCTGGLGTQAQCPDGMECVNLGPLGQRCMYPL